MNKEEQVIIDRFLEHAVQPIAAGLAFFDVANAFGKNELLVRRRKRLFPKPAPMRPGPVHPAGEPASIPQQEAEQYLTSTIEVLPRLPAARTRSRIASWFSSGTHTAVSSPARSSRARATASRRSSLIRFRASSGSSMERRHCIERPSIETVGHDGAQPCRGWPSMCSMENADSTATAADATLRQALMAGREGFELVRHRAIMQLTLVWFSPPIARIGCCGPRNHSAARCATPASHHLHQGLLTATHRGLRGSNRV